MDFVKFKNAVAKQFAEMAKNPLYRTVATYPGNDLIQRISADKDALWDTYLNSFPAGTNPMYRERTEYDCNCCRQFVRTVGNVVSIVDGKLVSIWDVDTGDANFQVVANALSAYVKGNPIQNVFLHTERTAGTNKTFEDLTEGVKTWDHFFVNIPAGKNGERNFVVSAADIGPKLSESTSTHDVMLRGLTELDLDSIDTVLEELERASQTNVKVGDILIKSTVRTTDVWYEGKSIVVTKIDGWNLQYTPLSSHDSPYFCFDICNICDFYLVNSSTNMVKSDNYKQKSDCIAECSISRLKEIMLEISNKYSDIIDKYHEITQLEIEKDQILSVLTAKKNEFDLIISKFKH